MLISPDAAIVQSKQAYLSTVSDLDKENKLLDDPKLADRVATITGRRLPRPSPCTPIPPTGRGVAIIDDPKPSMPGAWQAGAWRSTPGCLTS